MRGRRRIVAAVVVLMMGGSDDKSTGPEATTGELHFVLDEGSGACSGEVSPGC